MPLAPALAPKRLMLYHIGLSTTTGGMDSLLRALGALRLAHYTDVRVRGQYWFDPSDKTALVPVFLDWLRSNCR